MNYETSNPETTKIVRDEYEHYKPCEDKTRIMIAGAYPPIRQGLIQLINQEADLSVCVEAENIIQVLGTIKKQQIDLAIVDISLKETNGVQLAEEIKLQYPNLPVVIFSIYDRAAFTDNSFQAEAEEYPLSEQVTEQVIKAVRYIQSLLRSRIFGFTILVKDERSDE
jgi:DNA-binding NarL/FixJ family response regulator